MALGSVLNIRIPSQLKIQLMRAAYADGRTLSAFVVRKLVASMKAPRKGKK